MFQFHQYLQESELYPDDSPYFIESAPWAMAVTLNRYLKDIGEYSEIVIPGDGVHSAEAYVKVGDKVYSVLGEEPASSLGRFKVVSEDNLIKFSGIHINDMSKDITAAQQVIKKALNRSMLELIKKGPKQFDQSLFEVKMLKASQQGFEINNIMYHETEKMSSFGIKSEGFDLSIKGARESDETMPDGVFVKPNTNQIDVAMEPVQMPMLVRKGKRKVFEDRDSIAEFLKEDPLYKDLCHKVKDADDKYNDDYKVIEKRLTDILDEFGRRSPELKALREEMNVFLDSWKVSARKEATSARERATAIFKEHGIDVVRIKKDEGSFGRIVDTTIVLNPNNIRSLQDDFEINMAKVSEPEPLAVGY